MDDDAAEGSKSDTFEVLEYISLSISPTTQTFSGNPGAVAVSPVEGSITCTVTANTNFDIETKLLADWEGTTHGGTIGAGNTHALGEVSVNLTTTEYQNVWTDEAFGKDVERKITYTLDMPHPSRDDTYKATISINVKKHA